MTSLTAILIATGSLTLVVCGLTIWIYGLPWCSRNNKHRSKAKSRAPSSQDDGPDEH